MKAEEDRLKRLAAKKKVGGESSRTSVHEDDPYIAQKQIAMLKA